MFLGSTKPDKNGIRRIARNVHRNPILFTRTLHNACKKFLYKSVNPDEYGPIRFQSVALINHLDDKPEVYDRRFIDKNTGLEEIDYFEALPIGTEIMIKCSVDDSEVPFSTFNKCMRYIESKCSISQFGKLWGYGKFIITSIEKDVVELPDLENLEDAK